MLDAPRPFSAAVSSGAEPSILVTRDGSTILVGDTSGLRYSKDGGATWKRSPDPFMPGAFADGWAIAEDAVGRIYAADTQGQVIGVAVSETKGASWSPLVPVAQLGTSPVTGHGAVADRPWLAARGDGEVTLAWFHYPDGEACVRSTDAGRTFADRGVFSGAANAGNLVYDSKGKMVYSDGASVWTWNKVCLSTPTPRALPRAGPQIFTQVQLDASDRAYVAQPSPDSRAMQLVSLHGLTARTLTVSPPELRANTFGTLSIHGDEVAVAWYGSEAGGDPQGGSFEGEWNVFVARVTGFWTPTQEAWSETVSR